MNRGYCTLIRRGCEKHAVFLAKQAPQVHDYTTFEGVDVMFSGIGQKSVIEFKIDEKFQHLEIPNESILVVPR